MIPSNNNSPLGATHLPPFQVPALLSIDMPSTFPKHPSLSPSPSPSPPPPQSSLQNPAIVKASSPSPLPLPKRIIDSSFRGFLVTSIFLVLCLRNCFLELDLISFLSKEPFDIQGLIMAFIIFGTPIWVMATLLTPNLRYIPVFGYVVYALLSAYFVGVMYYLEGVIVRNYLLTLVFSALMGVTFALGPDAPGSFMPYRSIPLPHYSDV